MVSGPDGRVDTRPARGTRPANRRALIIAAAADLFYRKGYANVGMGDIAEAVSIGPSALYRHFRGKQELLASVVEDAVATVHDVLGEIDPAEPGALATRLTPVVLRHREVGVLWRREARHLDEATRASVQDKVRAICAQIVVLIRAARPTITAVEADLLGWCTLGVGTSISFHQLALPGSEFTELMSELLEVTSTVELPPLGMADFAGPAESASLAPSQSRREELLAVAIRMFSERGYAGVGIEDVGAAVGIAGPSIYNHFASKSELLVAAMVRGAEWLRMDLVRAMARAAGPADGLRRLLVSYSVFALEHTQMVDLLITEAEQLPEDERHRTRQAQYEYIAEWVHLMQAVHPSMDAISARIRVQAALGMMNDVALTPHLRGIGGLTNALAAVGAELLKLGD